MKKFYLFVGARPNFMKAAPLCKQFCGDLFPFKLFHSGQHYDVNLSSVFQDQLHLGQSVAMGCEIKDNAIKNIEEIALKTRKILLDNIEEIRCVVVFGDVLTTYAVTLAASHLELPIAHVEAGLRSFDINMPEELTRISVDHMSKFLFCPSQDAVDNLANEGITENVHMVGNIMIDCLINSRKEIAEADVKIPDKKYLVVTFHRPENIDDLKRFKEICCQLVLLSSKYRIVFPVHPRTLKIMEEQDILGTFKDCDISLCSPMGYFQFMKLVMGAKAVITDSGGIQEETTYLSIPCFTVRNNTERPITIKLGSNQLVSYKNILSRILNMPDFTSSIIPPRWDGRTARRIADILYNNC